MPWTNSEIVAGTCPSYSQFPIDTKPFENTCLIMMRWSINSKIQNKLPPYLLAKEGFLWQSSNISVLLLWNDLGAWIPRIIRPLQ